MTFKNLLYPPGHHDGIQEALPEDQGNPGNYPRGIKDDTVKVAKAERMIIAVTPGQDGIHASFADGCSGKVPLKSIPEIKDRSGLDAVELPNPYEIILTIT